VREEDVTAWWCAEKE